MKIIVLTGGAGTGLSIVSNILKQQKVSVINYKEIEEKLHQPNMPAYKQIVEKFGGHIVTKEGNLNNEVFRETLIRDPNVQREYFQLMHQYTLPSTLKEIFRHWISNKKIIVIQIPNFFEECSLPFCLFNEIVVVTSTPEMRYKRLKEQGISDPDSLMKCQIPIQFKEKMATDVIENNDNYDQTEVEVKKLIDKWNTTPHPFYKYPSPFLMSILLAFMILLLNIL